MYKVCESYLSRVSSPVQCVCVTCTTSVPSMIFLLYRTDGQCSESLAPPATMYDLSGYAKSQNLNATTNLTSNCCWSFHQKPQSSTAASVRVICCFCFNNNSHFKLHDSFSGVSFVSSLLLFDVLYLIIWITVIVCSCDVCLSSVTRKTHMLQIQKTWRRNTSLNLTAKFWVSAAQKHKGKTFFYITWLLTQSQLDSVPKSPNKCGTNFWTTLQKCVKKIKLEKFKHFC